MNMHQHHGILILLMTLINLTKYNVVQHDLSKETTGGPRQFQNLPYLSVRTAVTRRTQEKCSHLSLFYKGLHGPRE